MQNKQFSLAINLNIKCHKGENIMFNLTNKAMNHFLNFFKSDDQDETIKDFCQAEYKKDWYAAYMTFKQEGRFPNFIRRTL